MQPKRRKAPKKMRVQRTRVAIQTIPHEWPPSDAVQLGPYTLASGEYWVGDLCNVLKYEEWDEICGTEGFKTLGGGRDVVQFKLPEGGGIYAGKYGDRVHFIDSGTVGITLLEGLGPQAQATGHRTTYTDNFGCMSIKVAHPQGGGDVSFNNFGSSVEIESDDQVWTTTQLLREQLAAHRWATRLCAC
ncbi:hypothetical protein T484DRAFT_1755675 [Baffinella frigidus]|nr:hypothetical protein T484DRAFT_1755675 [Cryptophyta sp. CCMP2293]